jgi:hypothetical protein
LLVAKAPFSRLVREIAETHKAGLRFLSHGIRIQPQDFPVVLVVGEVPALFLF